MLADHQPTPGKYSLDREDSEELAGTAMMQAFNRLQGRDQGQGLGLRLEGQGGSRGLGFWPQGPRPRTNMQ